MKLFELLEERPPDCYCATPNNVVFRTLKTGSNPLILPKTEKP